MFQKFPDASMKLDFFLSEFNCYFSASCSSKNSASTTALDLEPPFSNFQSIRFVEVVGTGHRSPESWVFAISYVLET